MIQGFTKVFFPFLSQTLLNDLALFGQLRISQQKSLIIISRTRPGNKTVKININYLKTSQTPLCDLFQAQVSLWEDYLAIVDSVCFPPLFCIRNSIYSFQHNQFGKKQSSFFVGQVLQQLFHLSLILAP